MELDDALFDRIHRYLNRQMTDAEVQAFESSLQNDPAMKQELEVQRQIKAGFQVLGYRQTLDSIQAELNQSGLLWQPPATPQTAQSGDELPSRQLPLNRPVVRSLNWIPYAVAASVLLVAVWLFYPQSDPKQERVAHRSDRLTNTRQPSVPPDTHALPRGPIGVPPASHDQLLAKEYDKLVEYYFDPTLRLNPPKPVEGDRLGAVRPQEGTTDRHNDTTAIRTGIRLLQTGKAQAAIRVLTPATSISLVDWQANARWFLALAYLKNHQPDLARQQLRKVAEGKPNLYTNDAQRLLRKLSSTH